MDYPGHIIGIGADPADVEAVVDQLAALGYPSSPGQTTYDGVLASLVKLFQSRHVDALGQPLQVDGEVGPLTWGALFGAPPITVAPTGLAGAALGRAVSQVGVREQPLGSNRGPEVDSYNLAAGAPLGSYWCMSFVYWCFEHAAQDLGIRNDFPRTGSCLEAWDEISQNMPGSIIPIERAKQLPSLVRPGLVFVFDFGGGAHHAGFVKQAAGGSLRTIEGNSNNDGSNNGIGVFELTRRTIMDAGLKGFLDLTADP